MNERGPKIWVACAARDPYFRYLFTICVSPVLKKRGRGLVLALSFTKSILLLPSWFSTEAFPPP
jgi:hypothetical protein